MQHTNDKTQRKLLFHIITNINTAATTTTTTAATLTHDSLENHNPVQIPDAFRSAETVSQCSRTLADVVRRRGVVAACTVVPRSQIHFPTSWQDASNNINFDGIVFQVEQRYGKRVIFLPHLPPGTTLFNNTEEMANGQEEGQQEEITDALEMDEEEYALHSVWDLL